MLQKQSLKPFIPGIKIIRVINRLKNTFGYSVLTYTFAKNKPLQRCFGHWN